MSLQQRDMLEISELASAAADGRLGGRDAARLEQILQSSAPARAYYVRFMGVSAGLAWAAQERPPAEIPAHVNPAGRTRWWAGAAAAAIVLVASGAGLALLRPVPRAGPAPAVLVDAYHPDWAGGRVPRGPGTYQLNAGLARIQFDKGANVWLEGPTEFEVRSASEGYCKSGKVLVNVPPEAHGFRIGSPSVMVTDRGTGFGLEVRSNQTAVHVFKGEVDLDVRGSVTSLAENNAVLVDAAGVLSSIQARLEIFDRPGFIQHDMTGPEWAPPSFGRGGGGHHEMQHDNREGRGGPLGFIRDQLDVPQERWNVILPALVEVNSLQWNLDPHGPVLWRAWSDLNEVAQSEQSSEADITRSLAAYREARDAARQNVEAAEADLRNGLSPREESVLVTFGYLH